MLVPRSNVKNLVLRPDVMRAIEAGRFHIHAIDDVDDALEVLTGRPAGVRNDIGAFPSGSINAAVEARLSAFAERSRQFALKAPGSE